MKFRCISNNPMIVGRIPDTEYLPNCTLDLYMKVRAEILNGYKLLSHPLSSSIRPDISPYKTVLISEKMGNEVDSFSLQLIDRAIRYTADLYALRDTPAYLCWNEEAKKDFQIVDLSIVEQALEVGSYSE